MSDTVTCRVCGEDIGRRGIGKHAGVHKREFREKFGRAPEDYDEVVDALGNPSGDVTTLKDFEEGSA